MATLAARNPVDEAARPQPVYRRTPAYLIRRLQLISVAILTEALQGSELPVAQWVLLTMIYFEPDIDQTFLAELASIDKTNSGRIVAELETRGLIERRPSKRDRRIWMLRCTPRGKALRERLVARARASQELLLSSLSRAEQATFIELMQRVVAANETYVRPGAGRRKPKRTAMP